MFRRLGAFFLDVLEVIVLAFALFLFAYLLVFQPHKIDGHSMDPTFLDKEFLLTNKVPFVIQKKNPERGDVVVFKPPLEPEKEYIKRIIGLPGEKIGLLGGQVYINDKLLVEKYLPAGLETDGYSFLEDGQEIMIPEGQFFVMGDNRPNSSDSRYWGTIPYKNILGKAWFRYWPLNRMETIQDPDYN
jgi:signal peptidase I